MTDSSLFVLLRAVVRLTLGCRLEVVLVCDGVVVEVELVGLAVVVMNGVCDTAMLVMLEVWVIGLMLVSGVGSFSLLAGCVGSFVALVVLIAVV